MKRKKRILEKYDEKTGTWVSVPFDDANEEMIHVYEMMEAELEITAKQEAMKLGLYEIKNKS